MKQLGKYVTILPSGVKENASTTTGFSLSGKSKAESVYQEGVVKIVGTKVDEDISPGDRVLYNRVSGHDVRLNGETVRIVQIGDVMSKLFPEDVFG